MTDIAKLAKAYRDMEGDLDDIRRASYVLEDYSQDAILKSEDSPRSGPWRVFRLTDDQVDGIFHLIFDVSRRVRKLQDDWKEVIASANDDAKTEAGQK